MANIHLRVGGSVRALALSFALASMATLASAVTVRYDLDDGTLLVNAGGVGGVLDAFSSGQFGIGDQTFSPTVPNTFRPLQLDIQFWDAQTNMPQTLSLATLGFGGAQNAPSTFGGLSSPLAGHSFGPSMIISNSLVDINIFTVANATIVPWVAAGLVAADFTGSGGSVCGHGAANDCDFGARLPDLLDGPAVLSLSGFTVNFGFGVVEPTTFNAFQFNLISPSLTYVTTPVPVAEPGTSALILCGLAAVAACARRRNKALQAG